MTKRGSMKVDQSTEPRALPQSREEFEGMLEADRTKNTLTAQTVGYWLSVKDLVTKGYPYEKIQALSRSEIYQLIPLARSWADTIWAFDGVGSNVRDLFHEYTEMTFQVLDEVPSGKRSSIPHEPPTHLRLISDQE